jgi:antitoxin component YwqK of YwqJK toxin-antitoxin module
MRKIISLLFFVSFFSFAQKENDTTIYLDSTYSRTTDGNHKYYAIIKNTNIKKKEYEVIQYYLSGKIESKGLSKSNEYFDEIGEITSYYENGNVKSLKYYKEYYPEGKCTFWHENGTKKAEGEYIIVPNKEFKNFKNSRLKIVNYWDSSNIQKVINGEGVLEDDGFIETNDLHSVSNGKIKNGYKDENWIGKSKNPNIQFSEIYKNGELVSGTSIDESNQSHSYSEIMKKANPLGGIEVFYKYVQNNFTQPESQSFKGGKVITKFDIDENGSIVNVTNIKSLTPEVDIAAIKLFENFKNFMPAEYRGIKIKTSYTMPIMLQGNN